MATGKTFTFRAPTAVEALQQVTQKLGKNAVVIDKREVKGRGLLGGILGGHDEMVEIIAISGGDAPTASTPRAKTSLLQKVYQAAPPPVVQNTSETPRPLSPLKPTDSTSSAILPGATVVAAASNPRSSGLAAAIEKMGDTIRADLTGEIHALRALFANGGLPAVNETLLDEYHLLIEQEVNPDIARAVIEHVQAKLTAPEAASPERTRRKLFETISLMICVTPPLTQRTEHRPAVIAMIGSPGSGKTTAITKLAVEFAMRSGLRVGIIHEDRRPGAEAQYRYLAHLLSLQIVAADSPAQAKDELQHLHAHDVVLIDTCGRSPNHPDGVEPLTNYLQAVSPDATHLVLSAATSEKSVLFALRYFSPTQFDRILLSKTDEAATFGILMTLAGRARVSLSYITQEQDFRESAVPADSAALARMILGDITTRVAPPRIQDSFAYANEPATMQSNA